MLRRFSVHPLLFAAYPVVFLVAQNLEEQMTLATAALTLATVVTVAGAVFLLLASALRTAGRAGALTSLYVFLFFSFGHVATLLLVPDTILVAAWVGAGVAGTVLIVRANGDMPTTTMALNVTSAALLVVNLIPIATYEIEDKSDPARAVRRMELPEPGPVAAQDKRDIYYLVFDRYAAESVLEDLYGFDNSGFLDSLEARGFYVADSVSNHQRTAHSLASSLNMTYLNYLEKRHPRSGDYGPLYRMLKHFKVGAFLRSIGYRHHHVGSWWNATQEVPGADVNHLYSKAISEFSGVLLDSTLWPGLLDALGLGDEGRTLRERVKFQFAALRDIASDPEPTFTFVHFLVPHPPYVFNADGTPATESDLAERSVKESYVEQLQYTNDRLSELLDQLLEGPEAEHPIVVLQSDEGPHPPRFERLRDAFEWWEATDEELREKLLILNAYYLPGAHDDILYPTISPVNTFRVIFNEYFGTKLRLLEDRSFIWQNIDNLYDFKDVTDRVYPDKAFTQRL